MRISSRLVFAAIFVACVGLLAFALYLQEQVGLEPCPMCILQRYAFMGIAAVALVGAIHGPGRGVALKVYAGLLVLFALLGGGTAVRQSWIQHFPPKMSQSCGADLDFLVNNFPLSQALPRIFAGSGDCAAVHWRFVGLSIAEWALVWFVIFSALAIWMAFFRKT